MADSGRWFKLWTSSITDPSLDNLDISDFGRWCKFGVFLKEHGESGSITIQEPSRSLVSKMQVSSFQELINVLHNFPNCTVSKTVSNDGNNTVSYSIKWKNWYKYQGDFSTKRVKRHREKLLFQNSQNVTTKKRGEEKRGEEIKEKKNISPKEPIDFISKLKENPAYKEIDIDRELFKMDAWLASPKGKGRKKTHTFILNWLNKIDVTVKTGGSLADQYREL